MQLIVSNIFVYWGLVTFNGQFFNLFSDSKVCICITMMIFYISVSNVLTKNLTIITYSYFIEDF